MKRQFFVVLALSTLVFLCTEALSAQTAGAANKMRSENSKPGAAAGNSGSPKFKEVTKQKFKEMFFRLGGGRRTGWTAEYWEASFEKNARPGWKFVVEEPRSPKHSRMYIVSDTKTKEHRMYFLTEADDES